MSDELFPFPQSGIKLTNKQHKTLEKKGRVEVTYPVSYRYNGGIILTPDGVMDIACRHPKSKWYAGFKVPPPVIPEGYELKSLGCGLQLNARPPFATNLLCKK